MYIVDDGIKLDAALEKPRDRNGKCPIVIIIHGISGNKDEKHLVEISEMFLRNGFATLRVDMYGHGKSEGTCYDHTYFKWMTNGMKVIDYARSLDFVTDIYLCGHSQGGVTVMLLAALKHEYIKGLIALSPSAMRPEMARRGSFFGNSFDPENIPEEFTLWQNRKISGNYIRVSQTIHVEEFIDKYTGPVLIVVGTEDSPELVDSTQTSAIRYRNCEYVRIEGDTHCYDNHLDQVVEAVQDWIVKR